MKEKEKLHWNMFRGYENFPRLPRLLTAIERQQHKRASPCKDTLRIRIAHEFCVISAFKWARARTQRKRFLLN